MPEDVTIAMRSKAKMVSYGLAYGMESYGLAQRLAVPVEEAAAILKAYFEGFPNVRAYMDRVVAEARDRGYTETLFGRRRLIPELQSGRYQVRAAGERQAMNAGIQGLAADIFKVALVRLDARLGAGGTGRRRRSARPADGRPGRSPDGPGPRHGEPAGAAGPRRGDPGGPARGGRGGRPGRDRGHDRRRRAAGPADHQPVVGGHLGGRQGVASGCGDSGPGVGDLVRVGADQVEALVAVRAPSRSCPFRQSAWPTFRPDGGSLEAAAVAGARRSGRIDPPPGARLLSGAPHAGAPQ